MLRFVLRYLVGISGHIYWETQEGDFTVGDLPLTLFVGILGPFSRFGGLVERNKYKVLFPKK